jgi:hypothetical protein
MTNTTNTTKETNGKIKRTFTAILAAVMMMSTAATFAASAADTKAVVNMNTSSAMAASGNSFAVVELDNDLLKVKDVTSATLFKVFEEFTEYGKFFTPALSGILDMFIGGQPDPTQEKLDKINDKIDKLFDRIDKMQNELISTMETDIGVQSFHEAYTAFKAQTKAMRRKISEISTDTSLTQLDKIAKIGSLAGAYSEWDIKFENVLGQLNELFENPSATAKANIFDLTYRHFCGQVMFSGEALDKAKPLCDALMQTYIAGCTTLTECLSAQLYISQLPKEYQDKVDPAFKSHICLNRNDIINEIKSISEHIASQNGNIVYFNGKAVKYFNGTGGRILPADTKVEHNVDKYNPKRDYYYVKISYNSFVKVTPVYYTDEELAALQTSSALFKNLYDFTFNRSRRIYVNKNPQGTGREVNDKVGYEIHGNASYYDGKYHDNMSKTIQDWYNGRIYNKSMSFDDYKAIAKYCSGKGITIRTLLNNVGIDTTAVPQNANLVTSKAIDGSNGDADRVFREVYYEKTFYMGINIDQVGATEQQYQLLDCGWNLWKGGEEWNYAPGGAFCWI